VKYLPLIVVALVLIVAISMTRRNRQRSMELQAEQRDKIGFGTDVMTTSGLYGTVVGINDDDSVQLAIAPGVEVKWAMAALRDASTLPPAYRKDTGPPESPGPPEDAPPDATQS
jgi:preprotein translocase subunit YajC